MNATVESQHNLMAIDDQGNAYAGLSASTDHQPVLDSDTDLDDLQSGTILAAVVFSLFGFVAACGNAFVIFVFLSESNLRSAMNMYLASLAMSDFIVATLVMPLGIVQYVYAGAWIFGRVLCDLWHAIDVCASTASILNLCIIAVERYEAISDPIRHQAASTKRTVLRICGVWILSAVISFPAIAWWHRQLPQHLERHPIIRQQVIADSNSLSEAVQNTIHNGSIINTSTRTNYSSSLVNFTDDTERAHSELLCEFTDDPYYLIVSSMISFYVPCALMIVVYSAVYRTAVRVRRGNVSGTRTVDTKKTSMGSNAGNDALVLRVHRGGANAAPNMRKVSSVSLTAPSYRAIRDQPQNSDSDRALSSSTLNSPQLLLPPESPSPSPSLTLKPSMSDGNDASGKKKNYPYPFRFQQFFGFKQFKRIVREQKAAKMLGMIMAVFCVSWTPFFVCNLLIAFQSLDIIGKLISEEHEELVMTIVTWLGYASSCLNPFIYGFTLREFRAAFLSKICCVRRPARRSSHAPAKLNGAGSTKYESESMFFETLDNQKVSSYTLAVPEIASPN